jgi:starch-binding outer membrane protein, SusD/RagB family
MRLGTRALRAAALVTLIPLAACGDLFETEAPGRIADENLDNDAAVPGLVVGMSYDLAQAMDGLLEAWVPLAAGELFHGGSYDWDQVPQGVMRPEDVNGIWGDLHQARWVAETGIERIRDIMAEDDGAFERSPLVARAYLLGGFANRTLGENVCETAIDGGERQASTIHFERAIEQFDQAIAIGDAAAVDDVVTAAYGGRASAKAWLGDWDGAVMDAQQVPSDFEYFALLSADGESNTLAYETHDRFEYTVFRTEWADHPDDPRVPWSIVYEEDGSVAKGANGTTDYYQQEKYTNQDDDIALTKGTEMLVLRAEAALRAGDIPSAFTLLNEARAEYGMDPLVTPTSLTDAWQTLHVERGATTWLENRRLWDLRRWFEESGPAHHDFLADRDRCIPISEEELNTNENLRG